MIDVQAVTHRFGSRAVLSDVSVQLREHRIGVVGPNGSGKSTFARLLNGLQLPTTGRVLVDGQNTRRQGAAVRRRVGFVFQNPDNQIVFPTVAEDLAFGMKRLGLPSDAVELRIREVLEHYDLGHLYDAPTHHLSGGEKQLVALAGVLVTQPEHLVLDEPTTLLDLRNTRRVAEVIAALPQTVILVSHDLDILTEFDRVLVFDEGRLVVDDDPKTAVDAYVGRCA